MKTKDRILVLLSTFFWAMLGLFFFGTALFYVLPIIALFYVFLGGKR
jgi:hypothetical protein